MERSKLFVQGRISDFEVSRLNSEISSDLFSISKLHTGASIGGIYDIVKLLFDDLNPFSFVRDYILVKIIDEIYLNVKPVIIALVKRKKVVMELIIIKTYFKKDGSFVYVKFVLRVEKIEILIREIEKNISKGFFEDIHANKNVTIGLDEDDHLRIQIT